MKLTYKNQLSIEDIGKYSTDNETCYVDKDPEFKKKITKNFAFFMEKVNAGTNIYGATTGLGGSSKNRIDTEHATLPKV